MEDPRPCLDPLQKQLFEEALQSVIVVGAQQYGCDARSLELLQQTAEVAEAVRQLRLPGGSNASALPAAAQLAGGAAFFAGAAGCRLGVSEEDLISEALPSEAQRQQALQAVLPAVEAELQRRCRLVAEASGYSTSTDDYTGLPDHVQQLLSTRNQASQVEAWKKAAQQAQQALSLLEQASQALASILRRHKLGSRKSHDEALACKLHSECSFLRTKLATVELQLQQYTYTPRTVPVLRQVAQEVETSLAAVSAQLEQASLHLQQYRDMGPQYEAAAREHAAVLRALEETEYEVREIEQFRQLAQVTG